MLPTSSWHTAVPPTGAARFASLTHERSMRGRSASSTGTDAAEFETPARQSGLDWTGTRRRSAPDLARRAIAKALRARDGQSRPGGQEGHG